MLNVSENDEEKNGWLYRKCLDNYYLQLLLRRVSGIHVFPHAKNSIVIESKLHALLCLFSHSSNEHHFLVFFFGARIMKKLSTWNKKKECTILGISWLFLPNFSTWMKRSVSRVDGGGWVRVKRGESTHIWSRKRRMHPPSNSAVRTTIETMEKRKKKK